MAQAAGAGAALPAALRAAAAAAEGGVEATKAMVAQRGKAAAFQERTRGLPDAGATVGALILGAFRDFVDAG
jgi:dihydroxyacetone kinase-like protein